MLGGTLLSARIFTVALWALSHESWGLERDLGRGEEQTRTVLRSPVEANTPPLPWR